MKKMTTQEQFERNCEIGPCLGRDDINNDISVSIKVWDNRIGYEILCLTMVNPPERFKDPDFYGTPEWMTIKPELIKTLYISYSSIY